MNNKFGMLTQTISSMLNALKAEYYATLTLNITASSSSTHLQSDGKMMMIFSLELFQKKLTKHTHIPSCDNTLIIIFANQILFGITTEFAIHIFCSKEKVVHEFHN